MRHSLSVKKILVMFLRLNLLCLTFLLGGHKSKNIGDTLACVWGAIPILCSYYI